jgi:hypothetical protein
MFASFIIRAGWLTHATAGDCANSDPHGSPDGVPPGRRQPTARAMGSII